MRGLVTDLVELLVSDEVSLVVVDCRGQVVRAGTPSADTNPPPAAAQSLDQVPAEKTRAPRDDRDWLRSPRLLHNIHDHHLPADLALAHVRAATIDAG